MAMSNELKPGDKIISSVGQNAEQLAQALLGNNLKIVEGSAKLTISNTKQAGVFSGGTELLGIESGIVLSTGDCAASFSKASSGSYGGNNTDPDLDKLVIGNSGDTAILEFQLVATGSLLNFQYVFGSREFDQSEKYNDVFGLFVKINDGNFENLALLPSGESVSIKNLVSHPEFYIADSGFTKSGFNGISNVLTAEKKSLLEIR